MVEGLPKFHTTAIARGCSYFDMSWNFMPRRYDATAAKAILAGLDHLDSLRSQTQRSATDSEYWNRPIGICGGAFKSQIADSATKKVFMEKYFASLSESEKALVNMITAW